MIEYQGNLERKNDKSRGKSLRISAGHDSSSDRAFASEAEGCSLET